MPTRRDVLKGALCTVSLLAMGLPIRPLAANPAIIGHCTLASGYVVRTRDGVARRLLPRDGIVSGDMIQCAAEASAAIELIDGSGIRIANGATVNVSYEGPDKEGTLATWISSGTIVYTATNGAAGGQDWRARARIETPAGTFRTENAALQITVGDTATEVAVQSGSVSRLNGSSFPGSGGQSVTLRSRPTPDPVQGKGSFGNVFQLPRPALPQVS
ncbi:FecR domain-containing protein [Zavarzinia sp. CC-PAN008]|uniref:FecR domain-containing protein n=1 Tax=Zavarzinia sp. CC-PAN008 TaxID=3243332 RepID=UPI003F749A3A